MKRALQLLPLTLLLAGCTPHLMERGRVRPPFAFENPDVRLAVQYMKKGHNWTNVWVDVLVHPKREDLSYQASEFALYDRKTHATFPATRQPIGHSRMDYMNENDGGREGTGFGKYFVAYDSSTPPMVLRAGTSTLITLAFVTGNVDVRELIDVDLVFRGEHFPLAP